MKPRINLPAEIRAEARFDWHAPTQYFQQELETKTMLYTAKIFDMFENAWNFEGEVVGRVDYTDDGKSLDTYMYVEDFNIINIKIKSADAEYAIENINVMPDRFLESEIKCIRQDAQDAFIQSWESFQEDVHFDLSQSN